MTEVKAMTKFYDVTFQELSGRSVVKTEVASDFVVRIDVKEVDGPVDKQVRRRDELMNVVNTLSNMGL